MILNLTRTGSNWTRTAAYKAGQAEDDRCTLCGEKEEADHMWVCDALCEDRKEADKEISEINSKRLHPAIKQRIAPAMSAKLRELAGEVKLEG